MARVGKGSLSRLVGLLGLERLQNSERVNTTGKEENEALAAQSSRVSGTKRQAF